VRGRLRTITPTLSPVIWTSMATGVLPTRHGIVDFVATTGRDGELVPVTSSLRKVKAIWNILSEHGMRVGVVGWWASYPAEAVDGYVVSDRVAYQLFRAPLAGDQARRGRVFPPDIDPLVASLTRHPETISDAELREYIGGADRPMSTSQDDQQRIASFKTLLAAGDTYAATAESLSERFRPDLTAFYLEGTDTVAHLFMPYTPPPLKGTTAAGRRMFGRTVDAYYRHADSLLGRLIETVEPAAIIVCSDHGFRTGENRPLTESRIGYGPAADWHRKYGVIVLHGAPFRSGHTLEEASVLDITPTVLTLFGFPVAEDMDGRPLSDAFRPEFLAAHPIDYVPTYEGERLVHFERGEAGPAPAAGSSPAVEDEPVSRQPPEPVAGEASRQPESARPPSDPAGDEALMERLSSLGYLSQDSANSHNNRGLLLLGRGDYEGAIREFELAAKASQDVPMARFNLARAHYQNGDQQAASRVLHELLKRQPRSKEAENLLGNIAMDRGRLQEAEEHFGRALEIEPNFTDGLNSLGLLYDRQERYAEALRRFRRVVEIDPDYAEAYNNIGLIEQREARIDDSIATFHRAIAADPQFAGSYSNLAVSLERRGDLAAAEEQYREALRREPGNVKVRVNYGGLLYQQGRLQEARAELEQAVESDARDASAHNNLGAVYGRLGRSADAILAYRRAIALQPDYADARHNLGLALLREGHSVEGEKELLVLVESHPRYAPGYLTLGRHQLGEGNLSGAVDRLTAGVRAIPRNWELQRLLAEAYLRQGETAAALAALDAALAIHPNQPEVKSRAEALRSLLASQPAAQEAEAAERP
jgi:Tfp pilus assembly protein PilF